ncbi:hypothetical protein A1O1_01298 [Capronia coronata CBS 617.96]|uniref:SWR1-complex protein 3 domain-containing protein n=1 Tax=Capronia coronata CBS 617.96 TaxID=1182541 RepID=W9YTE3_9EURO|nr:uncharacterized protein A1O1_01298 [Capronia coronata CBS 617.96]EXJ96172.1 hypothetical protein A1O1_01298 [Capronia coronata CBS 617.96]
MVDATPQKRKLPARDRRDGAAKRKPSSPGQTPVSNPSAPKQSTPTQSVEPRQKRKYTKRASLVRVSTPASISSPSTPAVEETLPTRLVANKPLPTLKHKQPTDLSLNEYQSIAESAVLSVSLYRSRMQWLVDGVFKKYWVKPVKRKGVVEAPANNPDVKSMHKLGNATVTIEPHIFDAVFYTVRDPSTPQPHHRHANQHTTKNMIPSPSPYGMYHSPSPFPRPGSHTPAPSAPQHPAPAAQAKAKAKAPDHLSQPNSHSQLTASHMGPLPQPTPPQSNTPPQHIAPQAIPPQPQPAQAGISPAPIKQEEIPQPVITSVRQSTSAPLAASQPRSSAPTPPEPAQTPVPNQKPSQPPGGRGSTTDPVIQMLAARAASDPQLKELMKIVATSKASAEQLKEFQAHIDEFNEVVRRQEAERVAKSQERLQNAPPTKPPGPTPTDVSKEAKPEPTPTVPLQLPHPPPAPATAPPSISNPAQAPPRQPPPPSAPGTLPGVMHTFSPQTMRPPHGPGTPLGGFMGYPPPPQPPPPRPEPIIKHIVLELTSTPSSNQSPCQDRWLFPEHAVLEIRYGGLEMVCSFLVERKGSDILSRQGVGSTGEDDNTMPMKWKAEQEYYQPVTMTIKAVNHRTIETIARAAKPLPIVQGYMKEVMEKKERAPVEYLAYQLPREGSQNAGAEPETTTFVDSGVELGNESYSEDDELKDVYGV